MRTFGLAVALLLWASGPGCGAEPAAGKKLKVLTSFLPVYCFTAHVAGDLAEVENLLPAGVGPHDYAISPKDIRKLNEADLIVVNGLGLENWLEKLLQNAARPKPVVEISAGLKDELITEVFHLQLEGGHKADAHSGHTHRGEANPHIWLDPRLAAHGVTNILRALQKADPARGSGYAANAARYLERLAKLDAEFQTALAPVKNSPIVTYHDSFPYFARRYQLRVVGVIEEVPEVAPSPRYLSALQRVIRQHQVKVIFTEPQYSTKLARQLGRDLKVPLAPLDTLEVGPLKPAAYEEGMRRNLQTLQQHLK